MAGPDITTLFKGMTREEIADSIYGIMADLGLPVTSWQALAPIRTVTASFAQKLSDFSFIIAELIRAGFLDYATGEWLTILAKAVYSVDRGEATFAVGSVELVNTSGATYGPFAAGTFHVANEATSKTYNNDDLFSLGPGATIDIDITADEAGSDSSSGPLGIDVLATPLLGVTVSNAAPVLGADEQDDAGLRVVCRAKLSALSPGGANDAYNYVALTAPTNERITRATTQGDIETGEVSVYIATDTGAPVSGDVEIVQAAIDEQAEPVAHLATAIAATETLIVVEGTAYVQRQDGLTEALVQSNIAVAIADYLKTIPIGGILLGGIAPGVAPLSGIRDAVHDANAMTIDTVLTSPLIDTVLGATAVPKLDTSTFTVVFQ